MPPSRSYVAESAFAASSQSASHSDSSVAHVASQQDAALPPARVNTCPNVLSNTLAPRNSSSTACESSVEGTDRSAADGQGS